MLRGAVQRFNLITETLPVLLIGTLLNIVGRYLCEFAQSHHVEIARFLFLDMVGTAFSAIVLGPWWGAIVGIFSATINGNFYSNFFPFGIVNVCGALSWGYMAFALRIREQLSERPASIRQLIRSFLGLFLVGAFACGLASFAVEIVLYPPMQRPFVQDAWYERVQHLLRMLEPRLSTDGWTLFWGALSREFVDKTLTVFLALICVACFDALSDGTRPTLEQRIRVDALSILCFTIIYGAYLCFARIFRPTIKFTGGVHAVDWLTYPSIIALLYFPLILAIVAFFFQTLDQSDEYGRQVESSRLRRRALVRRYLTRDSWRFFGDQINDQVTLGKKLYGLIGGVAAWPLSKITGLHTVDFGLTYAGAALALVGYSFYQNRQIIESIKRLNADALVLRNWFDIRPPPKATEAALKVFARRLGGVSSAEYIDPSLAYIVVELDQRSVVISKGENSKQPQIFVVGLAHSGKLMDSAAQALISTIVLEIRPQVVFAICSDATDPSLLPWINKVWHTGAELYLMDWSSAERFLEASDRPKMFLAYLAQLRVSTKARLAGGTRLEEVEQLDYADLARRSLPGLSHVLERIDSDHLVMDLGAGRGRHTLHALQLGFRVIAIERKKEAYQDLTKYIIDSGRSEFATALLADYADIDLSMYGRPALVIATGTLQHVTSVLELRTHLEKLSFAGLERYAQIYIEMLFDMIFDDSKPIDGRIDISPDEFESELHRFFLPTEWQIMRIVGPIKRSQLFCQGPRSFYPPAKRIDLVSIEYLIIHSE